MVKCIGINDQAKSELLVSYAIIINEIYNKGLNVPDADVVRNSYTTTISSKSFTYIVPSSWKYVDVDQNAVVGGTVTVNVT